MDDSNNDRGEPQQSETRSEPGGSEHGSRSHHVPDVSCIRCETAVSEGGYQFKQRIYCDDCVATFERIAEHGVVVRSRHDQSNFHEKPYIVTDGNHQYVEHSQVEALARGRELADERETQALFIYWKTGSHWELSNYLETHGGIRNDVIREQRKIRGAQPIGTQEQESTSAGNHIEIRAEGDAIVDSTVVEDSVVNRSRIENGERR